MGLGDRIISTAQDFVNWWLDHIPKGWTEPWIKKVTKEIANSALDPEMFKTPEFKAIVTKVKADFGSTPETMGEVAKAIGLIVGGMGAHFQLEHLTDIEIDIETKHTNRLTKHMALVTDGCLFSNVLGVIGEFVPTTQLGLIGAEMRAYMDYSGMSQVSGFGYGMILNTALGDIIKQEIWAKNRPNILDQGTLRLLYMREVIGDDEYTLQMGKHGFRDGDMAKWFQAGMFWPGPTDFIRYAVRDVFNPEAVAAGQLNEAFPADILPLAAKAGVSEEIMRWEWASHWILPSPRQGYQMLHRKFIDEGQLRALLKVADFAPGWIQPLIDISYSPYTRVDARRMYEDGTLNDDEYVLALEEIGLPHDKAVKMLEWTQKRAASPDRDLTKANIMQAFKLDLMTPETTREMLKGLGYDRFEADLIVSIEVEKERLQEIRDELEVLRFKFARGEIVKEDFVAAVNKLGLPVTRAEKEIVRALRARETAVKEPSKEDVFKWLKKALIDEKQARLELQNIGFLDKHIDLYMEARE